MAFSTTRLSNSLLPLLLPLLPIAFSITLPDCQIKLNSSLSANGSSSWNSPSGEFAFGFRSVQLQDHKFSTLLIIWFIKVSNQTIVWSAKDAAISPGSTVKLTTKGIAIYNPQGKEEWHRPKNNGTISCAKMQDDGNFVLLDGNGKLVWQSFDEPTDTLLPGQRLTKPTNLTLLPGQKIDRPMILRVRQSDTTFSDGTFSDGSVELRWQHDGNLVLYYKPGYTGIATFMDDTLEVVWSSGTSDPQSQVIFDECGQIYIRNSTEVIFNLTRGTPGKTGYYYMARIDSDGVFRLYNHPKSETTSGGWHILETIPADICLAFLRGTGNVLCGFNSYCVKINGITECRCPDHFYPFQHDNLTGCRPDFPLPTCHIDGWEQNKDLVDFKEYENMDWPLSNYDLLTGFVIDEDICKQKCLDDCFCAAAIYDSGRCWKKKYPLSNGRQSKNVTRTALLKVPRVNLNDLNNKNPSTLLLVMSILFGSSGFFNIVLFISNFLAFYFLKSRQLLTIKSLSSFSVATVRSYSYKELEEATGGFKQILGKGAFGTVYKGVVASETRRYVAVKKLDKVMQEGEMEFKTEVSVIGQTQHKNLVRLLGYCDEGDHRLLVYEDMSNGSLASFLFGISRPHWNQRVQIALGISLGLTYLHEECSTQIIHCDIKPQNILQDELFTPRISDFGLAKLLLAEQTRAARTGIRGTVGYFAPEWFMKACITSKVDVYSFGVMLLEIVCCKSSAVFGMGNQEEAFVDWAYNCFKEKKLAQLVENDEEANSDMKSVEKLVMVAIWCIQEDASLRPSMKKITQMLEGVTKVSVPPRPSMFMSSA